MLYVTTRDRYNFQTPRHPICKDFAEDGGLYIPLRDFRFYDAEIRGIKEKNFGQCAADILNSFFRTKLTGWDIDFAVGRKPFRLVAMSHKLLVAELCNNPGNAFSWTVKKIRDLIVPAQEVPEKLSQWMMISVRIAVLFGLFAELYRLDLVGPNHTIDISVPVDDFSGPMSLVYAKEMGLPIGQIIYGCNENSGVWDMLHHGEIHTNAKRTVTETPACDGMPISLERLIYSRLGREEAIQFGKALARKGMYSVHEKRLSSLNSGLFGAVISRRRMDSVIRNVLATSQYGLDPYGALAYGALQDYRASKNEAGPALILSEYGVINDSTGL